MMLFIFPLFNIINVHIYFVSVYTYSTLLSSKADVWPLSGSFIESMLDRLNRLYISAQYVHCCICKIWIVFSFPNGSGIIFMQITHNYIFCIQQIIPTIYLHSCNWICNGQIHVGRGEFSPYSIWGRHSPNYCLEIKGYCLQQNVIQRTTFKQHIASLEESSVNISRSKL
jgi:hypothetical protein